MARGKVRNYDDDVLVAMLAGRRHTYAQIGQAIGLSGAYVGKVARGRRRPGVLARLRAVRQGILDEARRLGGRWSRALLSRHILVGLREDGATARKCREYVLDRCCFGLRPRPWRPALPWGAFLPPAPAAGWDGAAQEPAEDRAGSPPAGFRRNDPIPTQGRARGTGVAEASRPVRHFRGTTLYLPTGLGGIGAARCGISEKRPYTYPRGAGGGNRRR